MKNIHLRFKFVVIFLFFVKYVQIHVLTTMLEKFDSADHKVVYRIMCPLGEFNLIIQSTDIHFVIFPL